MESKILIVDDDKNLLSVLDTLFTEENYVVTTCSDGLEAIKRCRSEQFDLIITDVMMPGASGLEVLREVKRSDPNVLVILITGFASLETAVKAIREGAYDYITKPFKLDEIKIVVKNAMEKIGLLRENKRLIQDLQEAYEKLHLVREVMGLDGEAEKGRMLSTSSGVQGKTVIAGNLLPHHLLSSRTADQSSLFLQLERISRLREKGLITEREFEVCKSHLLQNLKS